LDILLNLLRYALLLFGCAGLGVMAIGLLLFRQRAPHIQAPDSYSLDVLYIDERTNLDRLLHDLDLDLADDECALEPETCGCPACSHRTPARTTRARRRVPSGRSRSCTR